MKSTTDYATWGVSPQELVLSIQFTHNLVQDNSSFDKVREAETCNTSTKCFILIQLQHLISFQSIQYSAIKCIFSEPLNNVQDSTIKSKRHLETGSGGG